MKLVFDKDGKIGLAQNGTIQQDWAYAWGGDNQTGSDFTTKGQYVWSAEPARAAEARSIRSVEPDRAAEIQSIRSAPDRAAGVQTLRLTVPTRRPANPLFLVEWLSSATSHFRNQLSYFFALGRTSTARKESIRKILSTVPAGLLVLGLIIVVAANCQQAPVTGTQVAAESTTANNNNSEAENASQVSNNTTEANDKDSTDNSAVSEAPQSTTGQAPFVLPPPPEAVAAEEKDASSASAVAPAQLQSSTVPNPSTSSVSAMDLSL